MYVSLPLMFPALWVHKYMMMYLFIYDVSNPNNMFPAVWMVGRSTLIINESSAASGNGEDIGLRSLSSGNHCSHRGEGNALD